jgi:hypothetical protein
MEPQPTPHVPSSPWRWLWAGLTSVIVIGAVAYPFLRESASAATPPALEGPDSAAPTTKVRPGRQYYVLLSAVEVATRTADGGKWDVGRPAPDIWYEIRWKNTVVHKSSRKDNTLLARWNAGAIEVTDLVRGVSVDDSIEAARVTVREGESLEFIVWDHDVAKDDEIARWTRPVTALQEGVQEWTAPAVGLVTVHCRVIPIDTVDLGTLTR